VHDPLLSPVSNGLTKKTRDPSAEITLRWSLIDPPRELIS
jgi:hypothetical protein